MRFLLSYQLKMRRIPLSCRWHRLNCRFAFLLGALQLCIETNLILPPLENLKRYNAGVNASPSVKAARFIAHVGAAHDTVGAAPQQALSSQASVLVYCAANAFCIFAAPTLRPWFPSLPPNDEREGGLPLAACKFMGNCSWLDSGYPIWHVQLKLLANCHFFYLVNANASIFREH